MNVKMALKTVLAAFAAVLSASAGAGGDSESAAIARDGGLVQRPYRGKYVVIVNNQSRVAASDLFAPGGSIEDIFNFPVKVLGKDAKIENAGVIVQVNDNKSAPSLLVAPEACWAGVNVAALATDRPKPEVLRARVQKEVMRAYLFAAGVANSEVQPCLMRPIRHAKDLDRSGVTQPGPSAVAPVMNSASQLGIFEKTVMTYREACEDGWAPAPTNDVQRAIWAETHKLPSAPLAIRPEPKKSAK